MNVLEAINTRWSVRSYESRAVEPENLKQVLDAGRMAPSARNMQDWRFVVVTDKAARAKLGEAARGQQFVAEAPVVIVACGTSDYAMTCGEKCYPIDVAIAVDHMTLAAVQLGLGTCWVGAFFGDKVKSLLSIPEKTHVVALLTLGYPRTGPAAGKPRKAFGETVAFERWTWTDA
jgi:nitroreductase